MGDRVLRRKFTLSDASRGISASLAPPYEGPYQITQQIGENTFILKDETLGTTCRRNADQLKPYHQPPVWACPRLGHKSTHTPVTIEDYVTSESDTDSESSTDSSGTEQPRHITYPEHASQNYTSSQPPTSNKPTTRTGRHIIKPIRFR